MIPVSVNKNTPPENKTLGNISFQSTKSGSGEQFLLQDCRAMADTKGLLVLQTPVCPYPVTSMCVCVCVCVLVEMATKVARLATVNHKQCSIHM